MTEPASTLPLCPGHVVALYSARRPRVFRVTPSGLRELSTRVVHRTLVVRVTIGKANLSRSVARLLRRHALPGPDGALLGFADPGAGAASLRWYGLGSARGRREGEPARLTPEAAASVAANDAAAPG